MIRKLVIGGGLMLLANTTLAATPLFTEDEALNAVLSAPLSQTYKEKKKDVRLYHKGTFSFKKADDSVQRLPVKIRTRGNFRRANCLHPPLRLNFQKKQNKDTLFAGQNKLKLVGPCKNGESFKELVALEYLAYQMFELVSDYHFKTRLLNLSYIDTDKKKKPWTASTFVIEDTTDMARRSKLHTQKAGKAKRTQMNLAQTALVEMFQLLIGNNDYSTLGGPDPASCCHNARLIGSKDGTAKFIPVPYDFDASGWVNAPYATPPANYPIRKVRDRYFSGWCKEDRHFNNAMAKFNTKKEALYALVNGTDGLSDKTRKKSAKYLDEFYAMINDPKEVDEKILGRCRGEVIKG